MNKPMYTVLFETVRQPIKSTKKGMKLAVPNANTDQDAGK